MDKTVITVAIFMYVLQMFILYIGTNSIFESKILAGAFFWTWAIIGAFTYIKTLFILIEIKRNS